MAFDIVLVVLNGLRYQNDSEHLGYEILMSSVESAGLTCNIYESGKWATKEINKKYSPRF